MKFIASLLVLSSASAMELATPDVSASSKIGARLLSKARQLENNNKNGDITWISGYSLKFQKCATSKDYYGGYFGGNGQNNNNKNNNRNGYNGMYQQRLVHFKLCPSSSCSSCEGGADYVIDMNEYVNAYVESKMEAQEYNCERVRENCYCEDANDDEACEANCYYQAGLDYCGEQNQNNNNNNNNGQQQQQFNLQEALECRRLEVDDEALQYYMYQNGGSNQMQNMQYYQQGGQQQQNNNNQRMELFVGPYCSSNGKSINLGVFMDETCSYDAPKGIYSKLTGQSLPYSSESLIDSTCVSCAEPTNYDDNNNGDQQDEDKVLEVCERLYEQSGKCEANLAAVKNTYGMYPNTYGCEFIKGLTVSGKSRISFNQVQAAVTPKALAGVFAATTVIFGATAFYLGKKLQRSNVNLVSENGAMA
ncbi:hypothetical protein ACHAWO_011531 [Cyclotella atomus]|uniref:Uncharacterized protein n=1 Tax=Cyclotella atomus TaxID=382360 RepID=A0ABD3MQY0_9STRA